jgi:hypothetical protein
MDGHIKLALQPTPALEMVEEWSQGLDCPFLIWSSSNFIPLVSLELDA